MVGDEAKEGGEEGGEEGFELGFYGEDGDAFVFLHGVADDVDEEGAADIFKDEEEEVDEDDGEDEVLTDADGEDEEGESEEVVEAVHEEAGRFFVGEAVDIARADGAEDVEEAVDDGESGFEGVVCGEGFEEEEGGGEQGGLEDGLDIVFDGFEDGVKGGGGEHELDFFFVVDDVFEAAEEEVEEVGELEGALLFLVEFGGVGEDEEEVGEVGDDAKEEEEAEVVEFEDEEDGEEGGEGGADEGEGAGATVYETFFGEPVFFFEVFVDHGFVGAGAEGFA